MKKFIKAIASGMVGVECDVNETPVIEIRVAQWYPVAE